MYYKYCNVMSKYIVILSVILFVVSCEKTDRLNIAENISSEIKNNWCPDLREAIFEVQYKLDGNRITVLGETTQAKAKTELLLGLAEKGFLVTDSLVVLPDISADSLYWGLVTISVCNLRSEPGHDAEMVSQAILGTPLKVLKKLSSWYLVQTPDKYISWVDSDAVVCLSEKQIENWRNQIRMVYLPSDGLAINPETGKVATDLVAGSILCFEKNADKNSILLLPDGRPVEVSSSDLMEFKKWENRDLTINDITNTALNFMGRPYLWGGTSTKGVDCSGFVKTAYFLNGYILARDASLQFLQGDTITLEQGWQELKEGDLVFFGKKATDQRKARATHVGYYLGSGEFIHSSGYVRVNSFDLEKANYSEYRTISWLGGRRIFNAKCDGIVKIADHSWY